MVKSSSNNPNLSQDEPTALLNGLASRIRGIRGGRTSPAVELMRLAAEHPGTIRLARGEPDIPTPSHIIAAAHAALDGGKTTYTDPAGLPELREAIARYIEPSGLHYDPSSEIIVTAGGQEAMALALQTLLDPGDEVILPVPTYSSYEANVLMAGGQPRWVETHLEDNFAISPAQIEAAITARTKLLAIVSPNNPTATVLTPTQLQAIAAVAIRRNLLVLSDELYSKIMYDGAEHLSIASLPGMRARTLTINGFSKTFSMTGFRVGYLLGPSDYMQAALEPRHSLSISTPTISQHAALAALSGPQDFIADMIEQYTKRRNRMARTFDEIGVPYTMPKAGFYFFADIRATKMSSLDFCRRGISDYGLWFSPGSSFGQGAEGFVRISFLAPEDVLDEGLTRFARLYTDSCGLAPV